MRKILISVSLAVLLITLFFVSRIFLAKELHFERLHFKAEKGSEILHFDPQTFSWRTKKKKGERLSKNIIRGTGIFINGEGRLSLRPSVKGHKGIFLFMYVKSKNRDKIGVTVSIKQNNNTLILKKFKSKKKHYSISRKIKFQTNDKIIIDAVGKGILIVGDPVIYDVIDKKKRKYVFVIAVDTLRWDKIGLKRGSIELTPNINAFKTDAVNFSNTFAQSSWTLPSFMSLFTGLYEYNHQMSRHSHLNTKKSYLIKNISSRFITACINGGAWLGAKFGNSRGVDYFAKGSATKDKDGGKKLFKAAINFMNQNPVPELFIFLHTYQVHAPYEPPEEFLYRLNKNPAYKKQNTFTNKMQFNKSVKPKEKIAMEDLYESEILAFDYYFGEFIKYLKSRGIYKQSLVVFLSDHGEEFYEHQGWSHGHSLYNEIIKVPLLIKFPGNEFGNRVVKQTVGIIDVFPTLMDYFNIKNETKLDGVSLLSLLTKGKLSRESLVISTSHCRMLEKIPPKFAILFDHYKLIFNYKFTKEELDYFSEYGLPPGTGGIEFFDLKDDPGETTNLYPGKMQLPESVRAEIARIINLINANMRLIQDKTITFDAKEQEQLKTLGYL